MKELIRDDMVFKPYPLMGGWICKINIKGCVISVRYGGHGLMTDGEHPYEVWYPSGGCPEGYQTADDIWNYINENLPKANN